MKIVEGLFYSNDHEWIKVEGKIATVGITDFAQSQLGEIVFVELPDLDDEFGANDPIGAIESVKAASDVLTPVSGKIVEVNENLEDAPESVNEDPFNAWIFKVELSNESELESLMNATAYKEFTA
ncbi:glycine cleavage system protein GcvH [Mycoplasmatota bacterium]|nr:glycine cleavage system protein GcvH [Mycoplasmatota bacterium]